jgi:hypothetical protein
MSARKSILLVYRPSDDYETVQLIGHMADQLRKQFGADAILDGTSVAQPGTNITQALETIMPRQGAVLVPIGPHWLGGGAADSTLRPLDNPFDPVRLQIEAALRHGIPIIPLLMGRNGAFPRDPLPPTLAQLQSYPSLAVRPAPDFSADMSAVTSALGKWVQARPMATPSRSRASLWFGLLFGVLLLVLEVIALVVAGAINSATSTSSSSSSSSSTSDSTSSTVTFILVTVIILGDFFLAGLLAARRTGLTRTGSVAGLIAGAVNGGIVALCSGITLLGTTLSYRPSKELLSGLGIAIGVVITIIAILWLLFNLGLGAAFGAIGGAIGKRGYSGQNRQ